jgi:geranylgeranyl pyrophosphate synthase
MAPYDSTYNIIMANACVKLVEGETLQAEAAKNGSIDRETYKLIIERKTASLFQAASKMGALLAGSEEPLVENLSQYAYYLGLAFQMVDDVLDVVGDPDILGKPIGSDVVQGMGGIVNQNGNSVLDGASATESDPIKIMLAQLRESGAIEIAKAQANEWANRAQDALFKIPESPARDELNNLIHLVVHRNR